MTVTGDGGVGVALPPGAEAPARRVAVCLSGVARNARQNLKFVRAFLAESGADVFFHFWATPDRDLVVDALRPKGHVFETTAQAPPRASPLRPEQFTLPSRLTNIPSMFYSIMRANDCKRAYEEEHGFRYDVVVRLRLDMFSITTLREILERLPTDSAEWDRTVYVPDMSHAIGLNDQLALGGSEAMDVYAATFERLRAVEREDDMYVAEYVLLRHVHGQGLRIRTFPFEYVLVRADPIATFDLEERIYYSRTAWPAAPLPNIAPDDVEAYLLATADSFETIDRYQLETPKSFRLRSASRGYVQFDMASRQFSFSNSPEAASRFLVIVPDDGDRRLVNIRPRDLALAKPDAANARAVNLRPDANGVVRANGIQEAESAFLLAAADGAGSVTFEWHPGFWRSPWSAPDAPRQTGGREHNPGPRPERRARLYLQATRDGLRVASGDGAAEAFTLEYVADRAVESSSFGLIGGVYTGPPRAGDPVVGRLMWLGYLSARTVEERGVRVVLDQAVAYVRRRLAREPVPRPPAKAAAERPRRTRI